MHPRAAFADSAHVTVDDIAKRLIDNGYAPTMRLAGRRDADGGADRIEEPRLDLCHAMLSIRDEIAAVEKGEIDAENNPLKHAPHTVAALIGR